MGIVQVIENLKIVGVVSVDWFFASLPFFIASIVMLRVAIESKTLKKILSSLR